MKSPFPGMDPYLESRWRDVHQSLVTYIRDAIQPNLPSALVARTEERVFVDSPEQAEELREFYPDIRVVRDGWIGDVDLPATQDDSGGLATATEPVLLDVETEPMTEGFVQILDDAAGEVVTVIEVLSPTNKRAGDGAGAYVRKRQELEKNGVGLVEIDLLRTGRRVHRVPERKIPEAMRTPYRACVRPGWLKGRAYFYPMSLRSRLPTIRVPLREGDADVSLDLQHVLEEAYRNGRYNRLNYSEAAKPPLTGDDAAWADTLLRAAGKR